MASTERLTAPSRQVSTDMCTPTLSILAPRGGVVPDAEFFIVVLLVLNELLQFFKLRLSDIPGTNRIVLIDDFLLNPGPAVHPADHHVPGHAVNVLE